MVTAAAPRASTESSDPPAREEPPQPARRSVPRRLTGAVFLLPAGALYALFVLWPLLQVAWLSLYRWSGYGPRTFIGFANFSALWNDPLFRQSLGHSALWLLAAVTVPTLIALALALAVHGSRGQTLILSALFFPVLLPPVVVAAVWVLVYAPTSGLLAVALGPSAPDFLGDPHLALGALFAAWAWSVLGIGSLILWSALTAIGREWTEIALIEGAGPLWRFRHVTLPGVRRALVIVLVVNAALAGQVFDLIFVTTGGGPGYATMLLPLEVYGRMFGQRAGQGAAAACVEAVLSLALAGILALLVNRPGESLTTGEPAHVRSSRTRLPAILFVPVTALVLGPLAWLIPIALQPGRSFAVQGPTFQPGSWTGGNVADAWNAGMAGAMATSLALALAAAAGTVLLASPAAFALARGHAGRVWRWGAAALLLAGLFQPTTALIVPLFSLLKDLHLLDTPWGILLPEVARSLPFAVLALWAFLAQTPREVLEAAEIDGASPLRQLVAVALPLARPALVAVGVWSFATSWNEYLLPILVSQDGSNGTVPSLLATFIGKFDTQLGMLAAGSLLGLAPSLLIYLALRRVAAAGLARTERTIQ